MKILLTGSTGFIGKNLVKFYSSDHELHCTKRNDDYFKICETFKPDLIINSAAEIYDKDQMFATNIDLVKDLCQYVRASGCSMIQLGSSSELGYVSRPSTESDMANPADFYGATKAASTLLCQGYARSFYLDIVIVRLYSPFGPDEKPHRLFPALWKSFRLSRPMILKNGVHDFLYIDDVLNGLDTIINSAKRSPGEIINLSSGVQTSNRQVYELFKHLTGNQGNVTHVNEMSTWDFWQADISHISSKYSWKPKHSLMTAIELFLERASYE